MTRKIFTRATTNLFVLIDFPEILSFFSLVPFAFFGSFFFAVCFFKLKMCILIHARLSGQVADKKMFSQPISGNNTAIF